MEEKIAKLEKQVRILSTLLMLLVLAVFLLLITRNQPEPEGGIIRVKGIIVEDSAGRERILRGVLDGKDGNETIILVVDDADSVPRFFIKNSIK
jgi:hypothetical protein